MFFSSSSFINQAIDVITAACERGKLSLSLLNHIISGGVLQELVTSKLLLSFRDILCQQDKEISRVFMSYSARTGEQSEVCSVWSRCLLLIDRLLEVGRIQA